MEIVTDLVLQNKGCQCILGTPVISVVKYRYLETRDYIFLTDKLIVDALMVCLRISYTFSKKSAFTISEIPFQNRF